MFLVAVDPKKVHPFTHITGDAAAVAPDEEEGDTSCFSVVFSTEEPLSFVFAADVGAVSTFFSTTSAEDPWCF
jgi:hypothetical protein